MNRNGTHVGRPPYTPEERMDASRAQFLRGLSVDEKSGHWYQSQTNFLVPGDRKVRKAKFSFMLHYPDHEFGPEDRVYVICDGMDCVNPKHMICRPTGSAATVAPITDEEIEKKLLAMLEGPPGVLPRLKEHALTRLKQHWREHPINEDHPDVDKRIDLFPEKIPTDPDDMRALAAEFGIITAA